MASMIPVRVDHRHAAQAARKTHCLRGHPLTDSEVGQRRCSACRRERYQAAKA